MSTRNESNKKALSILLTLVLTSVAIFCAERKFLVAEKRGETVSHYENVPWINQVNFLVDDFEGMTGDSALTKEKIFCYGSAKIQLNASADKSATAGKHILKVSWDSTTAYGGWGKGVGANIDLAQQTDYVNFRIRVPGHGDEDKLKITLEEDDNDDGKLQKDKDDAWGAVVTVKCNDQWQFISVPLKDFTDDNEGGDHILNVDRKGGLHTIIFSFMKPEAYTKRSSWFFDFIFFSSGKIASKEINTLN